MSRTVTVTEQRAAHADAGGRELYRAKQAVTAVPNGGKAGKGDASAAASGKHRGKAAAAAQRQLDVQAPPGVHQHGAATASMESMVTGPNIWKTYHPPGSETTKNLLGTLKLDTRSAADQVGASKSSGALDADTIVNEDGTISTGIQTAFRDGEAQTDPFSPEAIIKEGQQPEVARLTFLKFGGAPGHALPVGLADVEAVEEDRVRARIQRSLPPITDESNLNLRRVLMEDLELKAFTRREADADGENNVRLSLISEALEAQASERAFVAEQRVELLRRQLEEQTAAALKTIQNKRLQTLRKIGQARNAEERQVDMLTGTGSFTGVGVGAGAGAKKPTRDIIADYADPSSRVYAPMAREGQGRHLDKLKTATKFDVTSAVAPGLAGADALDGLTKTLAPSLFTVRVGGSGAAAVRAKGGKLSGNAVTANAKAAADAKIAEDLERVYNMIQTVKAGMSTTAVENEQVPAWRVPKPAIVRPSTPTYDNTDEDEETMSLEAAVSLLQTLLRGRAVQNAMRAGTERRLELIREMRADLLTDEEAAQLAKEEKVRAASAARRDAAAATVDTAAGEIASAALDFFAKELVRKQEMARISALAAAADAERKRREDTEAARRWDETHARSLEAAYARTAAAIVASAADAVVRMAFGDAIAEVAHNAAGRTTRLVTSVLRPIVEKLETEGTDLTQGLGLTDRPQEYPLPHERAHRGSPGKSGRPALGDDALAAGGTAALDLTADSLDLSADGEDAEGFSPAKAATKIQAIQRGRQDRKKVAALRSPSKGAGASAADEEDAGGQQENGGEAKAATKIQAIQRGRQDRKKVAALRSPGKATPAEDSPTTYDSPVTPFEVDPTQSTDAAVKIQALQRGRMERKKVRELRSPQQLQSGGWNAVAARDGGDGDGDDDKPEGEGREGGPSPGGRDDDPDAAKAAVRIQAAARGRQGRKKVAALKGGAAPAAAAAEEGGSPDAAADPNADKAAVRIQAAARGRQGRKKVAALKGGASSGPAAAEEEAAAAEAAAAADPGADKAATRIQSVARGRKDRKRVAALKQGGAAGAAAAEAAAESGSAEAAAEAEAGADDPDADAAAVRIQAIARGRKDRKKVHALKEQAGWSKEARAAGDGTGHGGGSGEESKAEEGDRRIERMVAMGAAGAAAVAPEEEEAAESAKAATRIQAVARGRQDRKKVAALKGGAGSGSAEEEAGEAAPAEQPEEGGKEDEAAAPPAVAEPEGEAPAAE